MTGLTEREIRTLQAMHERGVSLGSLISIFDRKARVILRALRVVLPPEGERPDAGDDEVDDDPFERAINRDKEFVAALMALGGMPRAVVVGGKTYWVGPDGGPWRERRP